MSLSLPTRRFAAIAAGTALTMGLVGLCIPSAFAVDNIQFNGDTVFQLDGSQTTPNGDTCVGTENGCPNEENPVWPADWDALLYPSLTTANPAITPTSGTPPGPWTFALPWGGFGSFSGIFSSSLVSTGSSTILKQGSKNSADISTWVVATQASPPKDAYLAAALATYTAPVSGDELLYFGSTRFKPNGSATIGIWFFQQNVEVCKSGPNAGKALCIGGTSTPAEHQVGDLFLFLTYGGNGTAIIQASTWQGANGPGGHLGPAPGSIVLCPTANDDACAVTNAVSSITLGSPSGPQLPGFGFNVSGPGFAGFPGGVVPALQFQEGGIDLNSIFAGTAPCFSSVMFASVTSGSSPDTAAMKSILLGSFNTCAITVNKSCGNAQPNTSTGTVTYTISGTVENTGGGAVEGISITDTFAGNPQAISGLACTCGPTGCSITGTDCSTVTLQPGATANYSATITTSANGGTDTVTATMGGVGGGSASATSNQATCPAVSLSDSVGISKVCDTYLEPTNNVLAVRVLAKGTVTNTSPDALTLTNIVVKNCRGGSYSVTGVCTNGTEVSVPITVPPGGLPQGGTIPWSDTYQPSSMPSDATTNMCPNGTFGDAVKVTASCASSFCQSATVTNSAPASCSLCPLHTPTLTLP